MFQRWKSLTFLHWRYELDEIQKRPPLGLDVDAYDGRAWIGVTPFVVSDLHAPFLPVLPWISHFPETNVRTYVRGPAGEPGTWFFTLEAARMMAVMGARMLYGPPYHSADMEATVQQDSVDYRSYREMDSKRFKAGYRS